MGDARQDDAVEIGQHPVECFALGRRVCRQLGAHGTRRRFRAHRERFDALVVIGDPVDDLTAVAAELLR